MKTAGVIGGLGPMATVHYLERITTMTDARRDQDHLKICMFSVPQTPDRTQFISGKSDENPLPSLIQAGNSLAAAGADFITVPCVTAHYFYQSLSEALSLPVLSLCAETARAIAEKNIGKVGILATDGTRRSRVLERELEKTDIRVIYPDPDMQQTIMDIIYKQIKGGGTADRESFTEITRSLVENGAQKIILGCTELCLLKKEFQLSALFVDVLEVLAQKTVLYSGAPLKKTYQDVIR